MKIPDPAAAVLRSDRVAHLATINPDGRAHVTCAWVGLDGDEIVMATLPDQRKLKNMRRDPRVTLSIETANVTPMGLLEYLVVYGRARVTDGGAPELLQELAYAYIGPGVKFPPMDNPPPGYVTRIEVERYAGVGPWSSG